MILNLRFFLCLLHHLIELSLLLGKAAAANEWTLQKKVFQVKTQAREDS